MEKQQLIYRIGLDSEQHTYAIIVNGIPHAFAPEKFQTQDWGLAEKTHWRLLGVTRPTIFVSPHHVADTLQGALLHSRRLIVHQALEQEDLLRELLFAQGGIDEFHIFPDATWGRLDPDGESIWTITASDGPRNEALKAMRQHVDESFATRTTQQRSLR